MHHSFPSAMKATQTNNEAVRETRFIRSHSPYCEATGPIVEKGFVAARIRALQEAYSQAWIPSQSHSPMTPCPINQRLQKYESYSSPKPRKLSKTYRRSLNLSRDSFANGVSKQTQNNSFRANVPSRRTSSSSIDTGSWKSHHHTRLKDNPKFVLPKYSKIENDAKTVSRSNLSTSLDQWADIHIPGPEPTVLATPLNSGGGIKHQTVNIESPATINSNSGGDKKQIRPRRSSITNALTSMIDIALEKHKPPSEVQSSSNHNPRSILYLADKSTNLSSYMGSLLGTECVGSTAGKTPTTLHSNVNDGSMFLEDRSQRKNYQILHKLNQSKNAQVLIAKRDEKIQEAVENISSSPKRIQRARTFQHPHSSKNKIVDPINPRSVSADCNPNRRNYSFDWNFHNPAQVSRSELERHQKPVRSKSNHQPPVENSNRSNRRQSSTSVGISSALSRSPSEKAPKRWRWWKLVLVDKQPSAGVASTKAPILAASIDSEGTHQAGELLSQKNGCRDNQNRRPGDGRIKHLLGECERKGEIGDVKPLAIVETIPKHGFDQNSKETSRTSYTCSTSLFTEPNIPKGGVQEEQLSEWLATLPQEESIQGSSPALHPRSQTSSPNGTKEHRHKMKGKRVKRIQVIVSLDGAADVVFEAHLEGKSWEV